MAGRIQTDYLGRHAKGLTLKAARTAVTGGNVPAPAAIELQGVKYTAEQVRDAVKKQVDSSTLRAFLDVNFADAKKAATKAAKAGAAAPRGRAAMITEDADEAHA